MKRIFAIVLLIIVSVNLYSCDPDQYIIEPESLEKVESIELIEYNNPDQNSFLSWVPNHFDDLKPFDFSYSKVILEKIERIMEIEKDKRLAEVANNLKQRIENNEIIL